MVYNKGESIRFAFVIYSQLVSCLLFSPVALKLLLIRRKQLRAGTSEPAPATVAV